MPRTNGIKFYQNRSKIKLFLPKKKVFFRVLVNPTPTPYASGGWGSCSQTPIAYGGWGIRSQTPQRLPHRRFLATRLHEEKFTARYCRPPFVLAFGFKYTWNVWRRRCSYSQTVYNTAESISPGNNYTVKFSQKILSYAPIPLWLRPR